MRSTAPVAVLALAALCLAPGCGPRSPSSTPAPAPPPPPPPVLRLSPTGLKLYDQVSGTKQRLQAVSAVNDKVVWASGTGGTFALTRDGGQTWHTGVVPEADSLQFRDVEALDDRRAWLLSAGPGTNSRIYYTEDRGLNWQLQFVNRDPNAFYDCFGFWDENHGLAFSDAVNGVFPILITDNGGLTWTLLSDPDHPDASPVPPATPGEGGFAASGTCVTTVGSRAAWIATGAGTKARLLYTPDRGDTWRSVDTPITQGSNTSGHTSIAFRSDAIGIAAGGDIGSPTSEGVRVVMTSDGGSSWSPGGEPSFTGAVYGAAYARGGDGLVVAVGPKGASFSHDDGRTWQVLDTLPYWSATFGGKQVGWLVGPDGRITQMNFP